MDNRDLDAVMSEFFADYERSAGVYDCPECEGTGEISEERHADLQAWAVARVDQFLAERREKERSV